jgi:flagellin-like hook-associated protein FlgL
MTDQLQADLLSAMSGASKIEDEISSGKKVNVPSDNPVV